MENTEARASGGEVPAPEDGDRVLRVAEEDLAALAASSRRISRLRLACFAVLVVGLFGAGTSYLFPVLMSLPALAVFFFAFSRHGDVKRRQAELERRVLLRREAMERRRSRRRSRPLPPPPRESGPPLDQGLRVYAPDPDSFELDAGAAEDLAILEGPRSLFGFLDVSSTLFGARRLRYMLTHPLKSPEDIRTRQLAIEAVARDEALRARLLEALTPLRSRSCESIAGDLEAPAVFAGRTGLLVLANVLGTLGPLLLIATAFSVEAFLPYLFFVVVINLAVIGSFVRQSNPARDRLIAFEPLLAGLIDLEGVLRSAAPENPTWSGIAGLLSACRPVLVRLRRWAGLLELHTFGVVFEILNVLTLWELRLLPAAEGLFHRHRSVLTKGLGALGETEALASLACPLAEQPGFTLPEPVADETPSVEAEGLGHPLIEEERLVRNPLELGKGTNVAIVTGSNMAGKSTYLKSLGTNVVLAAAGGPVCASSFRWTPLRVFSDINVRDSLDDGKSYFQVEVERVLRIIDAARSGPHVLAIFDELFRGTNSEERLTISRALLRHLRTLGALVLVATHDLALTRLVTTDAEARMANLHFREEVEGKTMSFDYRLHEGPAPTRNAIRVLEACGYPERITGEARAELETRREGGTRTEPSA